MTINNLFNNFDKDSIIKSYNSTSSQYDKMMELASFIFCSDKFDELEKREFYLEILALYGQLDKEY